MKATDFDLNIRYLSENGKRNMTVVHKATNIKITSPDYFVHEKSDDELKKMIWQIMKKALEIFT